MNFNDHKLECSSDNADVQMFLNKAQVKDNAMLLFHIGKNLDITHVSLLNEFQQKTDREIGTLTIDGNSDQAQAKNKIGPDTQLELTIRNLEIDQRNVLIQVRDIHRIQSVSYFVSNVDDLFVLKRPRMKTENLSENSFF